MFRHFALLGRLRVRLAVIVAVALAPAGVLAVSQAIDAIYTANAKRIADLEEAALGSADEKRAALLEIRRTIRAGAVDAAAALSDGGTCQTAFENLRFLGHTAMQAAVVNADGRAVCGEQGDPEFSSFPIWDRARETGDYSLSIVTSGPKTNGPAILAIRPLPRAEDLVLAVEIKAAIFRGLLDQPEDGRSFALLDVSGDALLPTGQTDRSWLPQDTSLVKTLGDRRITAVDNTGTTRPYYVNVLEPGEIWSVTAAAPRRTVDVFASAHAFAAYAPILLWLIAVSVAYFAIDVLVTRHVANLRRVAERIGAGDLDAPVQDLGDAPNEIRALGRAVKNMRDKIAEREASQAETLEIQRRLILEVHHRVKNNLQTISSLLNLEGNRVSDSQSRDVMTSIQNRIHSLAMVHQNLYAAERLEDVALDQLARDIATHLEASLAPKKRSQAISFELEPLTASTTHSTPIALFLSEAIGNAFKHGQPPFDIAISLHHVDECFELTVSNKSPDNSDQGDAVADHERRGADDRVSGLGLKLMHGFAKQIGAEFSSETIAGRFFARLSGPLTPQAELFAIRRARGDKKDT